MTGFPQFIICPNYLLTSEVLWNHTPRTPSSFPAPSPPDGPGAGESLHSKIQFLYLLSISTLNKTIFLTKKLLELYLVPLYSYLHYLNICSLISRFRNDRCWRSFVWQATTQITVLPERANALLMNNKSTLIIKCQTNQFAVQLYHSLGQGSYTAQAGLGFQLCNLINEIFLDAATGDHWKPSDSRFFRWLRGEDRACF